MRLLCTMIAMLTATSATAQTAPVLNAATARAIVEGCAVHAAAKRQNHAIVVVDPGGGIVAALRMDGNREGMMAFAEAKAKAVAAWGFSTAGMEEGARDTPGFARAPYVVTVPGGVPFYAPGSRALLGAVGTSGEAPADDVACAQAGIVAAGLLYERARPAG